MEKIPYILLFLVAVSCSQINDGGNKDSINKQVDTIPIKIENDTTLLKAKNTFNIDSLMKINTEWVNYYKNRINDFSSEKFELRQNWTAKSLLDGNIFGDYDMGFNKNHETFLVNSPDNNLYIDLDSYQIDIKNNNAGDLILRGDQVDQEINLVNRTTREVKRIEFFGPTAQINDAKWIDNNTVVLYGIMNDTLIVELIEIPELNYFRYIYPVIIEEENYNMEVRLNMVKYE